MSFYSTGDPFGNSPRSILGIRELKQRRSSTASKAFCLDANKFVLISFLSLTKTIYPRVSTKPLPDDAKSPPQVDVHRSKTLLRKLPIKILTWLRGFRDKIANFSRLYCPEIPRRDLSTKKTKPNIEIWSESLRGLLEFQYIERGLLFNCFYTHSVHRWPSNSLKAPPSIDTISLFSNFLQQCNIREKKTVVIR